MSGRVAALVAVSALVVVALVGYLIVAGGGSDRTAPGSANARPTASPIHPAPNGGNITETEAPGPARPTVKARITQPARLGNGVRIRVLSTETRRVKTHGPGELGGPAVVGRFEIENKSARPIDVDGAIVTLLYGHNRVAQPSTSDPSSPFHGTLRRGEAGRGIYVFRVPPKSGSRLSVVVRYGAESEVARFVS